MIDERAKRKLTAILSMDVKDYSRLMGENELGTVETLKKYKAILTKFISDYRGRIIDSPGDNMLAEFTSVVDAIECSISIQEELKRQNAELSENRRMEFRIGINLGDVIDDGERIYGDGINVAARIESLAEAGGISISGAVYDQIENKLPLGYEYRGEYKVKNISKPIRVYSLNRETAVIESKPMVTPRENSWRVIGTTLIFMLVVVVGIWYGGSMKPLKSIHEKPSIAVLPFLDMSQEKNQEYFADGLAEELLNNLSKIPELRVVGRTSSFQFKGKNEDLRVIGEKLNVGTILEGSVRKEGKQVRITTQLINATDGFHLWSETYDRKLNDIFMVQDEIARSVAGALQVNLLEKKRPPSKTTNTEAYTAYLMGQYFYERQTKESLEKAIDYFEQAIQLDPGYAPAWAGVAATRAYQAGVGYVLTDDGYKKAQAAVEQALELDQYLARAHSVKGWIQMSHDWDWTGAAHSYQRALSLESGRGALEAAQLAAALGRFEQSLTLARQAVEHDPLSAQANFTLAFVTYYANRLNEAEIHFKKLLELNPEWPNVHALLGQIYLAKFHPRQALAEIEQEKYLYRRLPAIALAYHALGYKSESDEALAGFIKEFQAVGAYQVAQVYAFRGEIDLAFQWLERAYTQQDTGLFLMKSDPLLKSLRGDPRYVGLLKKMRLSA